MKKRGAGVLLMSFELLAIVFVIALMIYKAKDFGTSHVFYKRYLAQDAAMTLNTVYASPGNVSVQYNIDASDYYVNFVNKEVQVYEPEADKMPEPLLRKVMATHGFVETGKGIKVKLRNPVKMVFSKKGSIVSVGE